MSKKHKKSRYDRYYYTHQDNNARNDETNGQMNHVVVNEAFDEKIPMYYLDSGVIITFAQLRNLLAKGEKLATIKARIMQANHNIDESTFNIMYDLFEQNMQGKVIFCVSPTVYKECVLTGNHPTTQQYIRDNCFLAMPKGEDFLSFARKTLKIQKLLKSVQVGGYGLATEWQKNKRTGRLNLNEKGHYVDDNLEDRLIVSEPIVLAEQGKDRVQFVSCGRDLGHLKEVVETIYGHSTRLDDSKESGEPFTRVVPAKKTILLQINGRDMGNMVALSGYSQAENNARHKLSVMLNDKIREIVNGDDVQVLAPADLPYIG